MCFLGLKKQFFFILRKTEKPYSDLFLLHHAISSFSELHKKSFLHLYGIQN